MDTGKKGRKEGREGRREGGREEGGREGGRVRGGERERVTYTSGSKRSLKIISNITISIGMRKNMQML